MFHGFGNYLKSFSDFAGRRWVISLILIGAGALLEGVGLLLLLPILDVILNSGDSETALQIQTYFQALGLTTPNSQLVAALIGFLILLLVRNVIVWIRDLQIMALSTEFIDHWRMRLFQALSDAPWSTALGVNRGDMEYSMMTDVSRLSAGTDRMLRGAVNVFMMTVQIVIAFAISPLLTTLVFVFFGVTIFLFRPMITKAQTVGLLQSKIGKGAHRALGQFLSGLKMAKAHKAEDIYLNRYNEQTTSLRSQTLKFMSQQSLSKGAFQMASGVLFCAVILVGILILDTPVTNLIVLLLIMTRLMNPFFSLIQSFQMFANMLPAYTNINNIESELLENAVDTHQTDRSVQPHAISDKKPASVQFDNVSFKHQGQKNNIISNLSFRIEPGSFVSVVGASGMGKTTLIDLMIGLLAADNGQVLVNGADAKSGRNNTVYSYVSQDPFLFDASLADNLLWPQTEHDENSIWQALETVGIADKIRSLPLGLKTIAGERGITLSGGERQRLCLARALLRNPQLLIMDEATNAIDRAAEELLFEKLEALRPNVTVIVISHRPNSSFKFDKIISPSVATTNGRSAAEAS